MKPMEQLERPFRGALTTAEAARETGRTVQAIAYAIRTGALKATRHKTAPRSPYWIDVLDLWDAYPMSIRKTNKPAKHWQSRMRNGWTVHQLGEGNDEADAEAKKWEDAANAVKEAIEAAQGGGTS